MDESSQPTPEHRNWRAYAFVFAAGVIVTIVLLVLVLSQTGRKKEEKIKEDVPRATTAQMPERDFTPPPPPVQPVATLPLPPAPTLPPQQKLVVEKPPPPPKPMISMFQTNTDSTAFVDEKKVGGGGMPPSLDDIRPGSSAATAFLNTAGTKNNDFVLSPYLPPMSPYILQAGRTIINAAVYQPTSSDVPGDIAALVSDNVCDTVTGKVVLIPANTILYGRRMSDDLRYGQSVQIVSWNSLRMPNGYSLNIGSMPSGVESDVDRHPWQMAGAVGLAAVFSILPTLPAALAGSQQSGGNTNVVVTGAQGAGQEAQSIGREFVTRELNRPNTLLLHPGDTLSVMLSKDIGTLTPYEDRTCD